MGHSVTHKLRIMHILLKQGGKGGDSDHAEPERNRGVREAVHGARRRQEGFRHRQGSQELSQGKGEFCLLFMPI